MSGHVAGATTGTNDESVLLDPSTAMAQRIEGKLRAALRVEHFVSHHAGPVKPRRHSHEVLHSTLNQLLKMHSSRFWATMQVLELIPEKDIADTSGNCGSSFSVTIVSPDFAKKMPLARHKMGEFPLRCRARFEYRNQETT